MALPSFDLIDIIKVIQKNFKLVLLVTLCCALLALVFFFVKHKKYKAESRFLVNNPLYGDRTTIFRSYETRYVDYFGGDDDLDKVTALASSDTVRDRIIRNCQFQEVYKMDINDPKGHAALMGIYGSNFNLKRSEYKDISISYIAYDPVVAANVANMSVQVLEETYRHYYTAMKENIETTLNEKISQISESIDKLSDSLADLRDKFGIYTVLNPNRQTVINGEIKGGGKGFGHAIEQIQNIEAIKDQLVADRAHYVSNLNEFSASKHKAMQFLKVITRALPPTAPARPSLQTTVLVGALVGLLFSIFFVLLIAYYKLLNSVIR